jgi:hypothetical protein
MLQFPISCSKDIEGLQSRKSDKSRANSILQNTKLDRTELSLCVSLIENGVNPEALAVSKFYHMRSLTSIMTDG